MSSRPSNEEQKPLSLVDRLELPGLHANGKHTVVRVSDDDWALAHYHGARRVAANKFKKDRASYRNNLNEEDRRANIDAVLCEVAVARHLCLDWDWNMASWPASEHHKHRHRADVGTNIEVRRVRQEGNAPSLRPWQVNKGLFLFAAYVMPPEGMNVKILGWRPYDDAWADAKPAAYDKKGSGSRTLNQKHLLACTCHAGERHAFEPGSLSLAS